MNLNWFANVLVHHPFVVLTAISVFSGTCLIIPFTLKAFPDFSDPQMGFDTRGTVLANRITTWKNLCEATRPSGQFAVNPKDFLQNKKNHYIKVKNKRIGKRKNINQNFTQANIFINEEKSNYSDNSFKNWHTLQNLINPKSKDVIDHKLDQRKIEDGFFCGAPDEGYAHVILKADDTSDLFTLDSLLTLCRLEHELIQAEHFKELCVCTFKKPKKCCRPWSLANYIAALHNRTSCLALTEEDVKSTKILLQNCAQYYHNLQLASDCSERGYCKAPAECTLHDAVFNILNFLTSTSFLPPNKSSDVILRETIIFLPMACSTATLPYYYELEKLNLEYEKISVVAMEFGIKSTLFDECLIRDAWLMSAGGLFILFCIWLYTKSLFLTIMTITAIVFSLGISYFLYTLVFELRFFPFMNLLATVVAIGIGADDAFIFCKVWQSAKLEKNSSTVKTMTDTFHHAFLSMFITSITTAAAFLASYISAITAVCCFSIFAAMAVMANCLLMMSWLPACMIISEKWCCSTVSLYECYCCSPLLLPQLKLFITWFHSKYSTSAKFLMAKEDLLINTIIRFRVFWFTLLTVISMASAIIVTYYPKLQLPNSPEFQLFDSSHPFEQYDLVYKNKFWFKRAQKQNPETSTNYKMPLRFVWGVLPVDNGNHLDPQSLGKLELDPKFDISKPESQKWLFKFCQRLRTQSFYQSTLGPLLPNCFIETFKSWMNRTCVDRIDQINRAPCCETQDFPYNSTVFNICIVQALVDLYETPSEYFIPGMAGPKFSKDQFPTINAIVVEYDSTYSFSMSYEHIHKFFSQVEQWTNEQLRTAPETMQGGWFISELEFYDLQGVLSQSTLITVCVSMALALIVLLLATLNVLTSLFAIITISSCIMAVMAVLVLLGWKLNVLESIAVSTAIGLTVDFSLHYAVNYKLCPNSVAEDRQAATRYALASMAGPSLMAALTTGAAGAFMMPSSILPYIQIGIFLVTVMSVSWLYATFYLGSMLAIAGPQNDFGQYRYRSILCCSGKKSQNVNNQPRRDRPTSSSLSETHELDSLTSKTGKPAARALRRSLSGNKNNPNRYYTDQSPSGNSAITIIMAEDN